jgi:hypothetical protein
MAKRLPGEGSSPGAPIASTSPLLLVAVVNPKMPKYCCCGVSGDDSSCGGQMGALLPAEATVVVVVLVAADSSCNITLHGHGQDAITKSTADSLFKIVMCIAHVQVNKKKWTLCLPCRIGRDQAGSERNIQINDINRRMVMLALHGWNSAPGTGCSGVTQPNPSHTPRPAAYDCIRGSMKS